MLRSARSVPGVRARGRRSSRPTIGRRRACIALAAVAADARLGERRLDRRRSSPIGAGASIGDRTVIYPNVTIGPGARIGDDCVIHSNVSIRERVTLGDRVVLQNGVVVGGDGYGFVRRADGTHEKIPQVATVVIEDDVELGANTTVDRPAVGETRIKAGAKIDNLVQIAHGVTRRPQRADGGAGRHRRQHRRSATTSCSAGRSGVGGHLTIGDGADRRRAVGRDQLARRRRDGGRLSGHRQPRVAHGRRCSSSACRS